MKVSYDIVLRPIFVSPSTVLHIKSFIMTLGVEIGDLLGAIQMMLFSR